MSQNVLNSQDELMNEHTQKYVDHIIEYMNDLKKQEKDLNETYKKLVKKNNFILDFLIVLSCGTTAGFFSFLALQNEVLSYITGSFSAISTVLSLLSSRWKYGEAVEKLGNVCITLETTVNELGFLKFRLETNECTTKEAMDNLEKLRNYVNFAKTQLKSIGNKLETTEKLSRVNYNKITNIDVASTKIDMTEEKDEILDTLIDIFK